MVRNKDHGFCFCADDYVEAIQAFMKSMEEIKKTKKGDKLTKEKKGEIYVIYIFTSIKNNIINIIINID